ncbi:MAG: hypothetical protein R3Y23_03880 [Bacillota bacterium]
MSKATTLFIVEGDKTEKDYVYHISKHFLKNKQNYRFITLPAEQNIYMLWKQLREDNFDTDIVEILRDTVDLARDELEGIDRDSIDQIFMFFDLDWHQNNLHDDSKQYAILDEMLSTFDNETDQGKLYISYPMAEALRDFVNGECQPFTGCLVKKDDCRYYKENSGTNNQNANVSAYTFADWEALLTAFVLRIKCLFNNEQLDRKQFIKEVNSKTIFQKQREKYLVNDEIFVLSAFPHFLLEYNKESFWHSNIQQQKYKFNTCIKHKQRSFKSKKH